MRAAKCTARIIRTGSSRMRRGGIPDGSNDALLQVRETSAQSITSSVEGVVEEGVDREVATTRVLGAVPKTFSETRLS